MKRIGLLALQGAFREHRQVLEQLGVKVEEVRLPAQLEGLDGLIIPGGESSTISKLMTRYQLDKAIGAFHEAGKAIWGTCAGAIVIARDIVGFPEQPRLGLIDIRVARNAYGRQVASFETPLAIPSCGTAPFPTIFIRAPRIEACGKGVEVLASFDSHPILVRHHHVLASVFHPELSGDARLHRYFIDDMVR